MRSVVCEWASVSYPIMYIMLISSDPRSMVNVDAADADEFSGADHNDAIMLTVSVMNIEFGGDGWAST